MVHSVGGQTREPVFCAGGCSKNFPPFPLFFFLNWLSPQHPVVHVRVLVVLSDEDKSLSAFPALALGEFKA